MSYFSNIVYLLNDLSINNYSINIKAILNRDSLYGELETYYPGYSFLLITKRLTFN